MTNHGECPKCRKRVLHVNVETVMALMEGENKARCVSYSCIHCNTVLGVHLDPRSRPRSKQAPRKTVI